MFNCIKEYVYFAKFERKLNNPAAGPDETPTLRLTLVSSKMSEGSGNGKQSKLQACNMKSSEYRVGNSIITAAPFQISSTFLTQRQLPPAVSGFRTQANF